MTLGFSTARLSRWPECALAGCRPELVDPAPQESRAAQQRARRPPRCGVQRPHEPLVKSEGRETDHRHTHTHKNACKLSLHLGVHACALCGTRRALWYHAHPDARAPAPSLSCAPQATTSERQQARSPPRGFVQVPHEPCVRREGRERYHRHAHAHRHAHKLSLHAAGGTRPRVVCHPNEAMLPRASCCCNTRWWGGPN